MLNKRRYSSETAVFNMFTVILTSGPLCIYHESVGFNVLL